MPTTAVSLSPPIKDSNMTERFSQSLRRQSEPATGRQVKGTVIAPEFQQHSPKGRAPRSLHPGLQQADAALEQLAMQLAAVTGAQTDRMTRDVGWRLLTVGRLIERLVGYTGFLRTFWAHHALAQAQGFDQLLDLFDIGGLGPLHRVTTASTRCPGATATSCGSGRACACPGSSATT